MKHFFEEISERDVLPWPPGTDHWHVHALIHPVIAEHVAAAYDGLPGVTHHGEALFAPVPPQWMHITIAHLADELNRPEVEELRRFLIDELAPAGPVTVKIGKAREYGEHGIACPISPTGTLQRLWRATREIAGQITAGPSLPEDYMPHLTVAYSIGDGSPVPARRWLADHDHLLPEIPVTIDRLFLVNQRHNMREITWRVHADLPLGRTAVLLRDLPEPGPTAQDHPHGC